MQRQYNAIDKFLINIDTVIKTLSPGAATANRPNPANKAKDSVEDDAKRKHIAGLMRINHTGEVCAQALYQGQACTAKQAEIRDSMNHAAQEEIDHLVWCEQRLTELNSHTSLLNPLFYAASFGIGASAGAISDKLSLGFVAATEDQVCKHLQSHLKELPEEDQRSRAILEQMLSDEGEHHTAALAAGGYRFPEPVLKFMALLSKVMTISTYKL